MKVVQIKYSKLNKSSSPKAVLADVNEQKFWLNFYIVKSMHATVFMDSRWPQDGEQWCRFVVQSTPTGAEPTDCDDNDEF